ncbi:hypothetical protein [Actinoplanes sp. NPDC049118]|uniref:hypothetical protein n=1 Tax=Actinoplanes sp. NPDC049118 TaxID=3155769 RepID=UPI0033E1C562
MTEDDLRAVRNKPEYKAGVWAFRVMLAVLAVNVALWSIDAGRLLSGLLWLAYLVAAIYGFVQFDRAGMRISGLSEDVWSRRKTIYTDVFRLGRR